jgi:hypothetical protein
MLEQLEQRPVNCGYTPFNSRLLPNGLTETCWGPISRNLPTTTSFLCFGPLIEGTLPTFQAFPSAVVLYSLAARPGRWEAGTPFGRQWLEDSTPPKLQA